MRRKSQLKQLALHLGRGKSITPMQAKQVYAVERLAARIYDLRAVACGLRGTCGILAAKRVDEAGKMYARYRVVCGECRARLNRYGAA